MNKKWAGMKEAESIVPLGKSSLYVLIKEGRLTKYKIGGKTVLSIEQLNALARPESAAA